MKETLKKALKWTLIFLPFAAIGGYFTGKYAFASYDEAMQQLYLYKEFLEKEKIR